MTTESDFPSRLSPHPMGTPAVIGMAAALGPTAPLPVLRFIVGRDAIPAPLSAEALQDLRDPFARNVLAAGQRPLTLRALLDVLYEVPATVLFVVAEGGQIPWTPETAHLKRGFRLVNAFGSTEDNLQMFVSSSARFDSESEFLQVLAWDADAGTYRFYDRRNGAWCYAGSSWDALEPDSRGKGPFDSHVNGAINMKELKAPWSHWHSENASIQDHALAPHDPLRAEPLWAKRRGAQDMERLVARPGIARWHNARVARCTRHGALTRLPEFMRHVLGTDTVNLVSSSAESSAVQPEDRVPLPVTFFLNADALVNELGLAPPRPLTVPGSLYLKCLDRYDVHLSDGRHSIPGDTHFAFLVPEPAHEDQVVLKALLNLGVLSPRFAACLLMVDFPNPVFSARRATLLRHVPAEVEVGSPTAFAQAFVATCEAAAALEGAAAEREFLEHWDTPEAAWQKVFGARIATYFAALQQQLDTPAGFARLFELAESRRRAFRREPLAEFCLTTPRTNIPEDAPLLELRANGTVQPRTKEGSA